MTKTEKLKKAVIKAINQPCVSSDKRRFADIKADLILKVCKEEGLKFASPYSSLDVIEEIEL